MGLVTNFNIVFIECSVTGAGALCAEEARKYGAKVYLLSDKSRYTYGPEIIRYIDEIVDCKTNDFTNVIETLSCLKQKQYIHAITTTADLYVPQASLAAREFNLIGLDPSAARIVRNKLLMRQTLSRFNSTFNPHYCDAYTKLDGFKFLDTVGHSIIAKPKNSDGGDKVELLSTDFEIESYFDNRMLWELNHGGQPYEPGILLEGFIDGTEFSVETFQAKGEECQVIGITKKLISGLSAKHFIEVGHYFPYLGPEVDFLTEGVKRVLGALSINCGLVHTECKIDRNGKLKIIEVNPRLAGGKIGSHLVELATGFKPVRAIIDIAIGKPIHFKPNCVRGAAIYYLLPTEHGKFYGIGNVEELKRGHPEIVDIFPLISEGQEFSFTGSNYDRIACIITTGPNGPEAFKRAYNLSTLVKINKEKVCNEKDEDSVLYKSIPSL